MKGQPVSRSGTAPTRERIRSAWPASKPWNAIARSSPVSEQMHETRPRSPKPDEHVERNNGARRYEFYATWDLANDDLDGINRWIDAFADEFNTFRPHQALGGQTPEQYLAKHAAEEPPPSHRS